MLADLQANILKGHGRSHTVNLFLQFDSVHSAQIKSFLNGTTVSDALTQLTDAAKFRMTRRSAGLVSLCFLTGAGYKALDVLAKAPVDQVFRGGMQSRQQKLNDPLPHTWDAHFQKPIHAMFLLAHDTAKLVKQAKVRFLASLPDGVSVVGEEVGEAMKSILSPGEGIEHFGYVDGRSQPLMLDEDIQRERDQKDGVSVWSPKFGLKTVLLQDPGNASSISFGSFLVFRKLEQNPKAFRNAEMALAKNLGLRGRDKDRAGAMIVGRFKDGTPVSVQREDGFNSPVPNNFNHKDDPTGAKCPFHGHTRKTNPRGDSVSAGGVSEEDERSHSMARRGITYGQRKAHPNSKKVSIAALPSGGVGLLFMAYQSDIKKQFEFVQSAWANNANFVSPDFLPAAHVTGIDPVIGQGPNGGPANPEGQACPVAWGGGEKTPRIEFDFQGFVRLLGGEYFFAPSITTLKTL